jgi:hypothetical protein
MFRALEAVSKRMYPDAATLPMMMTGATDMAELRAKGGFVKRISTRPISFRSTRSGSQVGGASSEFAWNRLPAPSLFITMFIFAARWIENQLFLVGVKHRHGHATDVPWREKLAAVAAEIRADDFFVTLADPTGIRPNARCLAWP